MDDTGSVILYTVSRYLSARGSGLPCVRVPGPSVPDPVLIGTMPVLLVVRESRPSFRDSDVYPRPLGTVRSSGPVRNYRPHPVRPGKSHRNRRREVNPRPATRVHPLQGPESHQVSRVDQGRGVSSVFRPVKNERPHH